MKANAALLLLLSGFALAIHATSHRPGLVNALGIVVLSVVSATTLEHATGIDLGIDRLLAPDVAVPGAPYPGRMALGEAIGFGAGALALLMLGRTWRGWHPSVFGALIVGVIGGFGVIGYAYDARELTSLGSVTEIAFPSALGFVVLAGGLLAADPQHGPMPLLNDPGLAGQVARRVLPTALFVVPLAGWLGLGLAKLGVFDEEFMGVAIVAFEVLALAFVGLWTTGGAMRLERERAEARRERDRVLESSEDLICVTDADGRLTLVSPSWTRHMGYEPEELLGHPIVEFVHPDDVGLASEAFRPRAERRERISRHSRVNRGRARDGTYRWLEWNTSRDPETGRVYAVARDVSERHVAEEAILKLNAELATSHEAMRASLDSMTDPFLICTSASDATGAILAFHIVFANRAAGAFLGCAPETLIGAPMPGRMPDLRGRPYLDVLHDVIETGRGWTEVGVEFWVPQSDGSEVRRVVNIEIAALGDGVFMIWRDVTEQRRAELEMRRLTTAIDQSADAVVITDAAGRIEYVNPAFEHVTGYPRDEVMGQNPRILNSGVQGPAFYTAMWAALTSGHSFTGDMTNRHKDGSLFREEAVISPVRDWDGTITSFVAVKRDVTRERASEAVREQLARERARIAGGLADLQVLPTPAATARLICQQVSSLAGVASATLYAFTLEGPATPLAFVRADGVPVPLRRLPFQRSRRLLERAQEGPWVEVWVRRPWHPYDRLFKELGVNAVACAPIRHRGGLIGLLAIASADAGAVSHLTESLPALLEFAGFAGALLGPDVANLTEIGSVRERISQTIRDTAFRPVFQPIVDLATGARLGYEALTRFTSGEAPDLVFADARVAGLEAELELATLAAAISSAAGLPHGAWLSLNVSPSLVTGDERLAKLLRRSDRPLVLEVTEHVPVGDYVAFRAAVGRLRPEVRIAVDDAGAGVANFSHIVELRPAFVKLDIGLVRGIDTDLGRRALMVGLLHFANESISQTIAEGVETEEELATLRELGVPLAQGYRLGRPAPVADWAERVDAVSATTRREIATAERHTIASAGDDATAERDKSAAARELTGAERDSSAAERDTLAAARDGAGQDSIANNDSDEDSVIGDMPKHPLDDVL